MNAKRRIALALALCLALGQPALAGMEPLESDEEILLEPAEDILPESDEEILLEPTEDYLPEQDAFELEPLTPEDASALPGGPILETDQMEAFAPGGDDNAARFAGYAWRVLYGAASRDKRNVGYELDGPAAVVYAFLRRQAEQAAAGALDSTRFALPLAELSPDKTFYTAADLGVAAVVEDGAITAEAKSAFYGLLLPEGTVAVAIDALLADCPYELYWYDKVLNTVTTQGFRAVWSEGEWALTTESASVTFSLPVAGEYALDGAQNTYALDAEKARSVGYAAEAARAVVQSCAGLTDPEKLIAYRRAICERVSYNASASAEAPYGNPWQLIWVFDGDDATNVVCEGYAKAFQYLCDLTDFSGGVTCWSVIGQMRGGLGAGRHMWNLVRMEDGLNYLVDVTNCDSGTLGEPDGLFLVGGAGSPREGYTVSCEGGTLTYAYDSDTLTLFPEADLTLSPTNYRSADPTPEPTLEPTPEPTLEPTPEPTLEPTVEPTLEPTTEPTAEPTPAPSTVPLLQGWAKEAAGWRYYRDGAAVTGWQAIDGARYWFSGEGVMKVGWLWDGGAWYYFDATGAMRVGWVKVQGRWYYMDAGGAMAEGWLRDGGDWYYLIPGSGAMAVGWRHIDGAWYFFNASGRMKTGWISDRGRYYYLSPTGRMRVGWLREGEHWYCLGASGAMRTGWVCDGGAYYYMGDGGAMLTGCWRYVDGCFYYFLDSGRMARSQAIPMDGRVYRFGSDGAWIP